MPVCTTSVLNDRELLKKVMENEICPENWLSLFKADFQNSCMESLLHDRGLLEKLRQRLSDVVGVRKKNARDNLFQGIGYSLLFSRKAKCSTDVKKTDRDEKKTEGLNKLFKEDDLSWWKMTCLSFLQYSRYKEGGTRIPMDLQGTVCSGMECRS